MTGYVFLAFKLLMKMMTHNYNTREKKHGNASNDDDPLTNTKLEENINHINTSVSSLRDEFLNLKGIIIKRQQDENTCLYSKHESLEDKVTPLEENLNSLDQHGRRNNIVLSDIPECVTDNVLEATVVSILADIDADVDLNALET